MIHMYSYEGKIVEKGGPNVRVLVVQRLNDKTPRRRERHGEEVKGVCTNGRETGKDFAVRLGGKKQTMEHQMCVN